VEAEVLTESDIGCAVDDFWTWAESILGYSRENPVLLETTNWFFSLHGIIKHYGVGQSRMMWNLRLNERVQSLFRRVWCEKGALITSFDGCSVVRPPEGSRRQTFNPSRKPWFHVDQTPRREKAGVAAPTTSWGAGAIQGAVNLYASSADDACFYILDGSHLLHAKFFAETGVDARGDFFMLSEEHIAWYEAQGCRRMAIPVSAGSVTLWDSRLVHCSKPPDAARANTSRWRLTAFVCMMPRRFAGQKVLERRVAAVRNNRTTCHWPIKPRLNVQRPRATHMQGRPYRELEPYVDDSIFSLV